jgi:hypothetical protein
MSTDNNLGMFLGSVVVPGAIVAGIESDQSSVYNSSMLGLKVSLERIAAIAASLALKNALESDKIALYRVPYIAQFLIGAVYDKLMSSSSVETIAKNNLRYTLYTLLSDQVVKSLDPDSNGKFTNLSKIGNFSK